MKHNLEECDLNTNHLDNCDLCGELTACVCLGAIVDEWEIEATGQGGSWAYRYQYKEKGSLTARFGYAESYRGGRGRDKRLLSKQTRRGKISRCVDRFRL